MTPQDLKAFIDRGGIVEMPPMPGTLWTPVHLRRLRDTYEMRGPTGAHRLNVHHTDAARLAAHWAGFQENTRNLYGS